MHTRKYFIGIFLISLATLLLELSLTRVMSVSLWYHFGFLVISTALLGFGAAGVTLASWRRLRETQNLNRTLAVLSLLFGVVTVFSFWLLQQLPFNPFSVATDKRQLWVMPVYYLTIAAPFFVSGLIISLLFTRLTKQMSRLYAVDLLGAAVGCLLIVVTMPSLGGSGSVLLSAALGALAALVFANHKWFRFAGIAVVGILGLISLNGNRLIPISITTNKRDTANKLKPIYTAWNTFSYIEVFERPAKGTSPASRRFVIDGGTAATGITDLRGGVRGYLQNHPNDTSYESCMAYLHINNPSVLNIGSGGGQEVLDALHRKARKIVCVEINPIINYTVQHRMNDFWGGLFRQPVVELHTDEGRNFINRSNEQYDAIVSSHTISNAAMASGALSLSENYVLTKEAFKEYYNHLSPNGTLFFTRPQSQLPRLFTTAREVLDEAGISNVRNHLYAFRTQPSKAEGNTSFSGGFIMKKSPFTPEEIKAIDSLVLNRHVQTPAGWARYEKLYAPFSAASPSIYDTIVNTVSLAAFYKTSPLQLAPATDDKPFFNQRVRWGSINAASFKDVFSQDKPTAARMALENKPVAEVTLLLILAQSILLAALLILLPLFRYAKQGLQFQNKWRYLGYFACLGLGFIMIEIAFIQRFTLYLGQPVYTLAVIIAGLLLSTGLGSYLTGKWNVAGDGLRKKYIPLLLAVLLFTTLLTPVLFDATMSWPLSLRIGLTLLVLAPMGVLLGMPFPTGIKQVSGASSAFVPWAWGVNGFFTVIGSVSAVILGMMIGFKLVIALAGVVYVVAMLLLPKIGNETSAKQQIPSRKARTYFSTQEKEAL